VALGVESGGTRGRSPSDMFLSILQDRRDLSKPGTTFNPKASWKKSSIACFRRGGILCVETGISYSVFFSSYFK
jgi:hypothetical protein